MNSIAISAGVMGFQEVITQLTQAVHGLFQQAGGFGHIEFLSQGGCPDSNVNFLVKNASGERLAVIHYSPQSEPDRVRCILAKSEQLKKMMGDPLGDVIPSPLRQGDLAGRSYCVVPYFSPLKSQRVTAKYDNLRVKPYIFQWLLSVLEKTLATPSEDEIDDYFRTPLRYLSGLDCMGTLVKDAAIDGLQKLDRGEWRPLFCTMHGDLWRGNILIDHRGFAGRQGKSWPENFVIIDWVGALEKGYAIYDLVRISDSLDTLPTTLGREVKKACATLQCQLSDSASYLAASLGYLGMNLGHFPAERYVELSTRCMMKLRLAI